MHFHHRFGIAALCASLLLTACSRDDAVPAQTPSASAPAPASSKEGAALPSILIERERYNAQPEAFSQYVNGFISTCEAALTESAKHPELGGRPYTPQNRVLSDAELKDLENETVLEAFEGERYVRIETSSRIDKQKWGYDPDQSCYPTATRHKIIEIKEGDCRSISIAYDLDKGTGTKQTITNSDCKPLPYKAHTPLQPDGEVMAIAGTDQSCRWMVLPGDLGRLCTLMPWEEHPLHQEQLLVASEGPSFQMNNPVFQMTADAVQHHYRPLRVEVGKPLPQGIFEVPDDAKNFPPPEGGNIAY